MWTSKDQLAWGASGFVAFACLRLINAYMRNVSPGVVLSLDYAFLGGALAALVLLMIGRAQVTMGDAARATMVGSDASAISGVLSASTLPLLALSLTVLALVVLGLGYQQRLCNKRQVCQEPSPRFYTDDQGFAWSYVLLAACLAIIAMPPSECRLGARSTALHVGLVASAACAVFLSSMWVDIFYLTTDG
jgi:hypothetical protein